MTCVLDTLNDNRLELEAWKCWISNGDGEGVKFRRKERLGLGEPNTESEGEGIGGLCKSD